MSDGIRHRGPDDDGMWISSDRRCGLAFRRLSIIDLSRAGHQPMIDETTGNVIVFNGEIYNYQSLRRDCETAGDQFRSHSDTEVILALYRRYGARCLSYLRGMFAFAIWNTSKRELFFARDRLGKKPLNYALTPYGLVFCSEIRPLSRHPAVSREHDMEALELYLQLQSVPAPRTIYRQIRKLRPAHYGILSVSGLKLECYWDVDYRKKLVIGEDEALERLEEKVTEAVRLRMISDVPIGALLSGGVDSSVVVAAMAKLSGMPVKTFSIGFKEEAFNELAYAAEAAKLCRTDHYPQIVEGDVNALLPKLVRHYGEPFADSSAIPSFFVSESARRHVTVVLNGDGGDELLGGYDRYWLSNSTMASASIFGALIRPQHLASFGLWLCSLPGLAGRVMRRGVRDFLHPELRSILMYIPYWNERDRRSLFGGNGREDTVVRWQNFWLTASQGKADNPIDRMLYFDNHTYLADDLLPKMDIASMHCGLEARSPLLDHKLIEFCASLPAWLKVKNGTGKYLLKRLAEKTFPHSYVHRRKMGFGIPMSEWLRGPLRSRLLATLHDRNLMEPFEEPVVRGILKDFLASATSNTDESRIWALFMYGLWRQYSD